jgi:hypothetical protein
MTSKHRTQFLICEATFLFMMPYTTFALMKLNNRIIKLGEEDGEASEEDFNKWASRHLVRSVLCFAAFGI